MKKKIVKFFATGAYAGYSPVMPGTVGTLWGVFIAGFVSARSPVEQAMAIIAISAASVYIASEESRNTGFKDHRSIVCDEVAGFLVSFFLVPFTLFNIILVFILFRFFDIVKPYPAGIIDRKTGGGLGIVLDDIIAGVYAGVIAHAVLRFLT
ncbi:MAG: phosphatidylglycerophosphatase A [Thermodesulfobacteriota bacterium]|nr:MAG: phosphatidylglycerophosphatase A [Thermodesulfobacteriota bacterium]